MLYLEQLEAPAVGEAFFSRFLLQRQVDVDAAARPDGGDGRAGAPSQGDSILFIIRASVERDLELDLLAATRDQLRLLRIARVRVCLGVVRLAVRLSLTLRVSP